MSHHHDHDHSHNHDHDHDHGHGHHHDHDKRAESTLSFEDKMIKLLEHWIKHNDDHVGTYRDWAQKAQSHGMPEAGAQLSEVADLTAGLTGKFEQILAAIKK